MTSHNSGDLAVVRQRQDESLSQVAPHLIPAVHRIDRDHDFAQRVIQSGGGAGKLPKLVTPWLDAVAILPGMWAAVNAMGAGRIPTSWQRDQIDYVATVAIYSVLAALLLTIAGVVFARRELPYLKLERVESKSSVRAMFLIVVFVSGVLTLIGLGHRLAFQEHTQAGFIALAVTFLATIAWLLFAIRAYRFAKSTPAEGKFITDRPDNRSQVQQELKTRARDTAVQDLDALLDTLSEEDRNRLTRKHDVWSAGRY